MWDHSQGFWHFIRDQSQSNKPTSWVIYILTESPIWSSKEALWQPLLQVRTLRHRELSHYSLTHLSHFIDGLYLKPRIQFGISLSIHTERKQEWALLELLQTLKKAGSDFTLMVKDDIGPQNQWGCEHAHSLPEAWQEQGSEAPTHFMLPRGWEWGWTAGFCIAFSWLTNSGFLIRSCNGWPVSICVL